MDAIIELIPPKIAAYLPLDTSGYRYATGTDVIDFSQKSFWIAAAAILFNPLYWNVTARNEYRNKTLNKLLGGPLPATYFFFVTIFSLGILRDHLYERALRQQPHLELLANPLVKAAAVALFVSGQTFVLTSMWALGLVGTYLGDYCGILMKERVTCFPFNVLEDPMYVGSAMAFLGIALWYESPAGILLSAFVWLVYSIALKYEGPFTSAIYSNAAAAKAKDALVAEAPSTPKKKRTAASASASASVLPSATTTATAGTPRKSGRLASKGAVSSADEGNGTPVAATPRRRTRKSVVAGELPAESSPMRVTRSRSKALTTDDESN